MIYFLRHGLDDERFLGGWSDVSLTEEGIMQVKKAAEYIVKNNFKVKKIYTSDIKRAVESAYIVSEYLNLDVVKSSVLRELNKGDLSGLSRKVVSKIYPDFLNITSIDKAYPSGESMREFYNRIKSNIPYILNLEDSLIITHRGVINMIYLILNNEELTMEKEKFGVTHASIHEYDSNSKLMKRIR